MNDRGYFENSAADGTIHVSDDEGQYHGMAVEGGRVGLEPTGVHSDQEYLNPIESQTNHKDEEPGSKTPPSIVGYVQLEGEDGKPNGKEVKFSQWLFESGMKLLKDMFDKAGQGIPTEKYGTSAHLEYLNIMFPLTRKYKPKILSKRIESYVSYCKNFVKKKYTTGQGVKGASMVNQGLSQEEELVNNLRAAESECKAAPPTKIYHGASTRYTASSDKLENLESLEDEVSCLGCSRTKQNYVPTECGQLCTSCYQNQMPVKDDPTGQNMAQKRQDEARMRQNEAMLNMEMSGATSGEFSKGENTEEKNTGKRKRRTTTTLNKDEEDDQKLNDMLMEHLQAARETKALEDKKKALEIRKLELEIKKLEEN